MAVAKKKKRLLLIFLAGYFVVSTLLAVGYLLDIRSPESKEAAEKRKAGTEAIYERLHEEDASISREDAGQVYNTLYGPKGSVMSVNLTIAMQVVNFAALLGFLYLLLWEPLTRFLDERRQGIRDELDDAKKKHEEAGKLLAEYKHKLVEARDDIAQMIDGGKKRGYEEEKRIIEQAREDVTRLRRQTEAELHGEVEEARRALRREVSSMSVSIARKILGREVSEEDHAALIKQAIAEIDSEQL